MGQTKARQHGVVTFEEIWVVLQIGGDRLFFRFYGGYAAGFSCCHMCQTSTWPSTATSVGAVNQMLSPGLSQFTRNSPPSAITTTEASRRPRFLSTATGAH